MANNRMVKRRVQVTDPRRRDYGRAGWTYGPYTHELWGEVVHINWDDGSRPTSIPTRAVVFLAQASLTDLATFYDNHHSADGGVEWQDSEGRWHVHTVGEWLRMTERNER